MRSIEPVYEAPGEAESSAGSIALLTVLDLLGPTDCFRKEAAMSTLVDAPIDRVVLGGGADVSLGRDVAQVIPLRRAGSVSPRPAPAPAQALPARPVGAVSPLRLTRRGALVVKALVAVLATLALSATVTAGVLLASGTAQGADQVAQMPSVVKVVGPGETLWQIAGEVSPHEDPRDVVLRIVAANQLSDANVAAGTSLIVPIPSP